MAVAFGRASPWQSSSDAFARGSAIARSRPIDDLLVFHIVIGRRADISRNYGPISQYSEAEFPDFIDPNLSSNQMLR